MEADHPNKNEDKMLAILDKQVWLNKESMAVYKHYEQPMANRQVIHEQGSNGKILLLQL